MGIIPDEPAATATARLELGAKVKKPKARADIEKPYATVFFVSRQPNSNWRCAVRYCTGLSASRGGSEKWASNCKYPENPHQ
jgi:hypothetical protein